MSTVTTSRVLLPRTCKDLFQSLTISDAFGARQRSKKAGQTRQPKPNKSTGQKGRHLIPAKKEAKWSVLQIHFAVDVDAPLKEDSLPRMEQFMKERPVGEKEQRRVATEGAHFQAGGLSRQSVYGDPQTPGVNVGAGRNHAQPMWIPINRNNGSTGDSHSMAFPPSSIQNSFNPINPATLQNCNAFGGFQPLPFIGNMGMPMNPQQFMNFQQPMDFRPQTPPSTNSRHRLEITPPSAASGGIPDPTAGYLIRSSVAPRRRDCPGPLLVVIDLNGTLLHRPKANATFQRRAHADIFLNYCIRTFWVVIWSSAKPDNVTRMVAQLLPERDVRRQVVAVWARDKFGLSRGDYDKRTQCYKRLTRLWDDPEIQRVFPVDDWPGRRWDQGNTVLIDDSAEKARSEPYNAVTLPEFTGGACDGNVEVLPKVHDYLNELCYHEDASAFMRANPFDVTKE